LFKKPFSLSAAYDTTEADGSAAKRHVDAGRGFTMAQRILAVDDEENIVRLLQIRLQTLGYEVAPAYDGETALQHVAECPPDLILLDVMMPKLDGFEVLRRLKSSPETAEIPVIMLTARGQFEDLRRGYGDGVEWYINKPFDMSEVEWFVRHVIGPPTAPPDPEPAEECEGASAP
jgi:DNA-binding response OmpR family regulator